jgi:quinol monooxygenase YgiN
MSTHLNIFYELKVAEGKAEELKAIVKAMVAFNLAGEPGTLVYNVYMSTDQSTRLLLAELTRSKSGPR